MEEAVERMYELERTREGLSKAIAQLGEATAGMVLDPVEEAGEGASMQTDE